MATAPVYYITPHIGVGTSPATADTGLTTPTNTTTVLTGAATGTKVSLLKITQILTTASAGYINIFLYDGSTYYPIDNYVYGTQTISATVQPNVVDYPLPNPVILPSASWSIRITNTAAVGTGSTGATHRVTAFGLDA